MSERVTKIVEVEGEQVALYMRKMMTPCTREEYEAMTPKEREGAAVLAPLNQRIYAPEEGIVCMQDVPVKMRDGITIYADIYKPEAEGRYPLLIAWSFYGKRPFEGNGDWFRMGVPPQTVSDMSKYESPDPGYWCRRGYAVANVDPRGIGHSEGDFIQFGTQDGRDGYDFIEWAARQLWCNGRCGMGGNSCVAMTQWRIAVQQPPHLACIAPWESTTDQYRESMCVGGIGATTFLKMVMRKCIGENYADSPADNLEKYPYADCAYWRDKEPDFKSVTIPVYQTGCWNHFHLRGSVNAFRKCRSRKKWLRIHREFEWPDAYNNKNLEELERFYARYLKLERNGWELTPKVRLEVEDVYAFNYDDHRVENEFPLKRTQYEKLYLEASDMSMKTAPVEQEHMTSYESTTEEACFNYRFPDDTELTGYMKLRPGEIVPVDVEFVPCSRFWHKGQQIRVQVAGRYIRENWFEPLTWDVDNQGRTRIYTGGQYESFLQIPVIPPRFRDGDIIIR